MRWNFFFLICTFSTSMVCSGFSLADISIGQALVSLVVGSDFHRHYFSNEYADTHTQNMVQEIKEKMGFNRLTHVHVMYFNAQGFSQFGVNNLIATHNTIFIDKSWFNSLSDSEQRFLIAHELAHLYTQDVRAMSLVVGSACAVLVYKLNNYFRSHESLASCFGFLGFCCLVIPAYGRYMEQRADANGAKALGTTEGGITCFKQWITEEYACKMQTGLQQFYYDMFATHPTSQRRLEALEALHEKSLALKK